ncbi:hypothetical protein CI102_12698 [Trichoderma harzianum]|nr:hypothetical protein CI102_12698 [Trichoderma harzianum]
MSNLRSPTCPSLAATCMAILPRESCLLRSAPRPMRKRTISSLPVFTAIWRAVAPCRVLVTLSTLAVASFVPFQSQSASQSPCSIPDISASRPVRREFQWEALSGKEKMYLRTGLRPLQEPGFFVSGFGLFYGGICFKLVTLTFDHILSIV